MALEPSRYLDKKTWKMTPAMIRARQPYFKKNMIALGLLLGITTGVYVYTFNLSHKDNDFIDVPIPPIDEKELAVLQKEFNDKKN
ncbi:hypothetical protein Kpol_1027p21 [Vanderwaltozyma polyspora DSM 70294]|uniref:Cytochrome c oxidase assembly factor 3, mitochondrial n=1 Tax=Vanderwaltozyma polyspora (strain ATCC 22028 / DSM 70294 / BCRC 21397 / CBS 2163 / NBRC 10782 / NRRL Y-8283 / UCD 57-17) TaxID=436907 RepID=COA3_VANPO|nr:uncharacterized protein Kpol_1027p21 [Vanderwaltozyma polyspora DSM 70294]A7TQM5.1 RecName: Full=Cytochrome c oxidase assembly factor 3, mitochondrial [Vanderwaltozyma polyspora DSM 70294]EDO15446.1 hypothetical protein Kpol_1027p21 [Vanderwaltozyma polyspora DSM 70294]